MTIRINIIFFSMALFISCANPVSPTGGPKDITPPSITNQYIDSNSQKNTLLVHLEFDEYFNIKNDVHYNPQTKKPSKPRITKTSKSALIEIPNVATSYNLGSSISDLNENNIGIYPTTYLKSDTLQIRLVPLLPTYFEKNKKTLSLESKIDTLYYRSYSIDDTLYLDGIPSIHTNTTLYLDNNKNSCYDSTEWFCSQKLDSVNSILLYPPLKNRLEIDTSNGYATVVSPFYLKPAFLQYTIPGDTFLMDLEQFNTWIATFTSTTINYKKISYPIRTRRIKSILNEDTIIKWESPIPPNLLNTPIIVDTTHILQKCGIVSFSFNDSIPQLNLLILKDGNIYLHETIDRSADSIILPVGEYHFITYSDLNNDGLFNSLQTPDKIYNYFDKLSVNFKLSNVITIGIRQENNPNMSGKTNSNILENLSPKNPVNTTLSIPN